jgi:hypothetical protein
MFIETAFAKKKQDELKRVALQHVSVLQEVPHS